MKHFIDKASILIEALPYIQKFKDKKVVIKYGGSVISEEIYCESVLRDVVFMRTVGMQPIIVHGGGKLISQKLKTLKIQSKFVNGLRYTDLDTLKVVADVLRNDVSKHVFEILSKFGSTPEIMNGMDNKIIKCIKKTIHLGVEIDLGYVGEIVDIDVDTIINACNRGIVPVISPIGIDDLGQTYNINADSLAGELSARIHADKMVYMSDIPGILKNVDDPNSLFSTLKKSQAEELIKNGTIHGGMIPKIQACLKSLEGGSQKTHIIDGRVQHSLLLEIFTDKGVGTQIINE